MHTRVLERLMMLRKRSRKRKKEPTPPTLIASEATDSQGMRGTSVLGALAVKMKSIEMQN